MTIKYASLTMLPWAPSNSNLEIRGRLNCNDFFNEIRANTHYPPFLLPTALIFLPYFSFSKNLEARDPSFAKISDFSKYSTHFNSDITQGTRINFA